MVKSHFEFMPRYNRRSVALGLFSLGLAGFCKICNAQSQNTKSILCASAKGGLPDASLILNTTGDKNLDRILAAELKGQSDFFRLKPAFLLYSGQDENALATTHPFMQNTNGTIMYNLNWLKKHLTSTTWGGAVVSGILAHEFAHIYQFHSDYARQLRAMHQTVKFQELHADFLSGFYMGKKSAQNPIKLEDYYDNMYNLGDYKFDSVDHHGTRAERYFSIKGGYNLSIGNRTMSVESASAQGVLFLKEYVR